ncbi:MAG: LLM class flavin-dependent oxidoreductase [Candidatus Hodarchaeota archaeon]
MKFSFGLQLEPQFGYTKSVIDSFGKMIQNSACFDTIWVSDHMFLDENAIDKSAFDAWTLMTYLLTKYEQLRVGSLVLCNSYRFPSILAKKITTLDNLSQGRLELGYGAGWKKIEYEAYGFDFPSAKVRLEQLEEGLQVLIKLWNTEGKTSFSGKYYTLKDAICFPKPFHKPHPRLWIGTMTGGDGMLKITAKFGDGINLAWAFSATRCKKIFQLLDNFARQFNRDPSDILRSVGFWVRVYSTEDELNVGIKEEAKKRNISLEDYQKRIEGALIGTKEQVVGKLQQYIGIGVTHFIFMFPYQQETRYFQIFNDIILPQIC